MTPSSNDGYRRANAAFEAVLPFGADLQVATDSGQDFWVNGIPVEVKWLGAGWRRDVLQLLSTGQRPHVVVAPEMSEGAKELLRSEGIGWIDETGGAEIVLGTLVVSRSGRSPAVRDKEASWIPSTLAVAEAILVGIRPTVDSVHAATGLSTGSVGAALRFLQDQGLLVSTASRGQHSARSLSDKEALLQSYAAAAAERPTPHPLSVGVIWRDVVEGLSRLAPALDESTAGWAATGAVASLLLAPVLTNTSTADIYVDVHSGLELEAIARRCELRPIVGGKLRMRPFPTATSRRLATPMNGIWLCPWPRVYADLRSSGSRGEEAADHLWEEVSHGAARSHSTSERLG